MQLARVGAFLGAVTAAVAVSVLAAAPAQAHTPKLTASCEEGTTSLTVDLQAYAQSTDTKANHITVTLDGVELEDKDFGASFTDTYTAPGDADHEFVVEVTAHDDEKYSFTEKKTVEKCVEEEVPSESSSAAATTTTTTTTTVAEVAPVTTSPAAVVPVGEANPLANTGASIAIPLVIGIVLLGGGVALLVVLRRRAASN